MHSPGHSSAASITTSSLSSGIGTVPLGPWRAGEPLPPGAEAIRPRRLLHVGEAVVVHLEDRRRDLDADCRRPCRGRWSIQTRMLMVLLLSRSAAVRRNFRRAGGARVVDGDVVDARPLQQRRNADRSTPARWSATRRTGDRLRRTAPRAGGLAVARATPRSTAPCGRDDVVGESMSSARSERRSRSRTGAAPAACAGPRYSPERGCANGARCGKSSAMTGRAGQLG